MSSDTLATGRKIFNKVVTINARPSHVWHALTTPEIMKSWLMPDIEISVITDWATGSPLIIRGNLNGKKFENYGTVLQFEAEKILRYSHLSSISRLPDQPASYTIVEFRLQPIEKQTALALTLSNFPTESIYQHLAFYWTVTLEALKRMIEERRLPLFHQQELL